MSTPRFVGIAHDANVAGAVKHPQADLGDLRRDSGDLNLVANLMLDLLG